MTDIIYSAYSKYLTYQQKARDLEYKTRKSYTSDPKLSKGTIWPTDVGKCHRAAMLRARGQESVFTANTSGLDYMNTGLYTEAETLEALKHVYGARLTEQVVLRYEMWSGKADFGIDIGTDNPIIIEHKTTSEKHFDNDMKTELPRHEHIGQAVTYMWLYEKLYNVTPVIILFYKAWGKFAEFKLSRAEGTIRINSNINGVIDAYDYSYDVYAEIELLMSQYHDDSELPPKLDKQYKGCTFMGKPSCQFYNFCWGNE